MKNRKEIQKYFKSKYYNKDTNYKTILCQIKNEEKNNKNKLFKAISTIIITLLGTTSIVFASSKIYNEYIKQQEEINSSGLYTDEQGFSYYEVDLTQNDMIYDEQSMLYYKIISDLQDYDKYKSKVNELPDISKEKFQEIFVIIIANTGMRQPHESDLNISEIKSDETTLYITMDQKAEPDYNNFGRVWYAVVDKMLLRNNVKIISKYLNIENPNFVKLENLPDNYSIEQALIDGCFVEKDYTVLSKNQYAIDELIEKAKKR